MNYIYTNETLKTYKFKFAILENVEYIKDYINFAKKNTQTNLKLNC